MFFPPLHPCSSTKIHTISWGEHFVSHTPDISCQEVESASSLNCTATSRLSPLHPYLHSPVAFGLKPPGSIALYRSHFWIWPTQSFHSIHWMTSSKFSLVVFVLIPAIPWMTAIFRTFNAVLQFLNCQCLLSMFYFTTNSMSVSKTLSPSRTALLLTAYIHTSALWH